MEDIEQPEGTALDEIMETNGLYQLIEEPTNMRNEGCSCIDLISTDQPNMFIDYGVHPSLDEHCQHQIIHGKLNVSLPSLPPYERKIWDYSKTDVPMIIESVNKIDWAACFDGLNPTEMIEIFTNSLSEIFSEYIPNKIVKFDDRDPPWMKQELKTAIRRKHRIYAKFVRRNRKHEDWDYVKNVQNQNLTSVMIINAKNDFYLGLGRKLSNNVTVAKSCWALFNRLLNKKTVSNIPPLIENGLFINGGAKANSFNEFFVAQCREIETGSTIPTFIAQFPSPLLNIDISMEKVLRIIRSLDTKKAHGCDGIYVAMIKICDNSIVDPLCCIFERCLEPGIYPSQLKKANIIDHFDNQKRRLGRAVCSGKWRPRSFCE